jgi:hypothetical protein
MVCRSSASRSVGSLTFFASGNNHWAVRLASGSRLQSQRFSQKCISDDDAAEAEADKDRSDEYQTSERRGATTLRYLTCECKRADQGTQNQNRHPPLPTRREDSRS